MNASTEAPPGEALSEAEDERQVNVARQLWAGMGGAELEEFCVEASRAFAAAGAAIGQSVEVICAALPKLALEFTPEQLEAAERWQDAPNHILKRYGHLTPLELDREMERQSTMRQATVLHLRHARESRPRTSQRRATTSGTRAGPEGSSGSGVGRRLADDEREARLEAYRRGDPVKEIAAEFGVSHAAICRLVRRHEPWEVGQRPRGPRGSAS